MALAAAVLALTAACGSGGSDTTGTSSTGSGAVSVLRSEDGALGRILVDRRGRTVYVFAKDAAGTSSCTGACATNWPPVVAPDPLPSSVPGVTGDLGATERDDGSAQLTVADHPVYTFSGDTEPGETNGQGVTLDGGLWTVVSPAGDPVRGSGEGPTSDDLPGYGY